MFRPLPEQQVRDLPDRTLGFWRMIGPGAVLVGLSVGAGEIVIWPMTTAKFGPCMTWAAVLGVFMQLWVNFEIGRWTVATGETSFTGFARVWRGFAPLFIALTVLGWLIPGWARVSGQAMKALLVGPSGYGSDAFWTAVTFAMVALLLFGPKVAYNAVEKTISLLVVIITVGLVLVAILVGNAQAWGELWGGMTNFGYRHPDFPVRDFFSALVFAGAGGTANLFYSFYLRDKHIGMGAHLPSMQNPLRTSAETIPATGFRYTDDAANQSRFKRWYRYIVQDQILFFWFLNTFTMMLFIFGAIAVLIPEKVQLNSGTLIWDQSQVLGKIWGAPGRIIFLLVGVATLFSTQLALVDGAARSVADIVYTNFSGAQKRSVSWWYAVIAAWWIVSGTVLTYILEKYQVKDTGFLFNAAYMGGFAMAVYVPLQLYINLRYLPASARPKWPNIIMVSLAGLLYVAFAVYCLVWELSRLLGS